MFGPTQEIPCRFACCLGKMKNDLAPMRPAPVNFCNAQCFDVARKSSHSMAEPSILRVVFQTFRTFVPVIVFIASIFLSSAISKNMAPSTRNRKPITWGPPRWGYSLHILHMHLLDIASR